MEVFNIQVKRMALCILAILLMVAPLMASCNGETETSKPSSTVSNAEDQFPLEKKQFDTTIKILCVSSGRHRYGEMQFVANEEKEGNVINDAVAKRNDYIEQEYGIKIEVEPVKYPGDEIKLLVQSGTDEYQLVNDAVYKMVP
jgi:maltose-binding protein MalE